MAAGPLVALRSNCDSSAASPPEQSHASGWRHNRFLRGILRKFMSFLPIPAFPPCKWLALPQGSSSSSQQSVGSIVVGTLYGYRRGHVFLAVQEDPKSEPVVLLELATPTSCLVREMSSGLLRIALECERGGSNRGFLFQESIWSMFCNGRKAGYAVSRHCGASDARVLGLVQSVSMGAGVLPGENPSPSPGEELMYMRAKFERVVGSNDSEALYMVNPNGSGAPELSIFFLRI
ncbi:protein MIZU-KUSSEI 1 [Selaginella moellendorffii]|nr:protein MIZU-KUSSEI 1 [Selaginella moellendorffii]|eukprot:XP_002993523.2 protein MIZU-KUSSEI 1 [Selaginella moellendorffii]